MEPKRVNVFCPSCKEATTHVRSPESEGSEWVCLCCRESRLKGRTGKQIKAIRKSRKAKHPFIG
jgi:ribosomal protein L44E